MWENEQKKEEKRETEGFEDLRNLFKTSAGIWSDEDTGENGFFFSFCVNKVCSRNFTVKP